MSNNTLTIPSNTTVVSSGITTGKASFTITPASLNLTITPSQPFSEGDFDRQVYAGQDKITWRPYGLCLDEDVAKRWHNQWYRYLDLTPEDFQHPGPHKENGFRTVNVELYADDMDNYVGAVSRIYLKPGYEVKVYCPNGKVLHIDPKGKIKLGQKSLGEVGDVFINPRHTTRVVFHTGMTVEMQDGIPVVKNTNQTVIPIRWGTMRDKDEAIASSMNMDKFVRFCADRGVQQEQFMQLPLGVYTKWVVWSVMHEDEPENPETTSLLEEIEQKIAEVVEGSGKS